MLFASLNSLPVSCTQLGIAPKLSAIVTETSSSARILRAAMLCVRALCSANQSFRKKIARVEVIRGLCSFHSSLRISSTHSSIRSFMHSIIVSFCRFSSYFLEKNNEFFSSILFFLQQLSSTPHIRHCSSRFRPYHLSLSWLPTIQPAKRQVRLSCPSSPASVVRLCSSLFSLFFFSCLADFVSYVL